MNQPSFLQTNSRRVGPKTRICEKEAHSRSKASRKRAREVTRYGVIPPVSYFSCKTDERYRYMYETTKKRKSTVQPDYSPSFFNFLPSVHSIIPKTSFLLRQVCLGFLKNFFLYPVLIFWIWKCENRWEKLF